ncbi:MAG: exported protein of unknown function [Ilumatobacteraceae bacterium]|nr:exported protein of unknown function [Ilumatobacteraceae bacterium]
MKHRSGTRRHEKDVTRPEPGRKRKKLIIAAAVVGGLALTGGIAAANWNASSSGSAAGKAISATPLTITAAASPTADLYPGATGGIQFTVTNPNPYPVSLSGWTASALASGDTTNCPVSGNVSLATSTGTLGTPIAIAAGATTAVQTISGVISMTNTAANGCQGVTFTVTLNMTGTQT